MAADREQALRGASTSDFARLTGSWHARIGHDDVEKRSTEFERRRIA